jgi:hypothetical protein
MCGIQRVVLEHHRDVAVARRDVVDDPVPDPDLAAGRLFQTGHHAQRGGLPAARRPHQNQELAVVNLQVEVVDRGNFFLRLLVREDFAQVS